MELFVDSSALSAVARFLSGISTPNAKIVEVDDKIRSDSEHVFKKVSPKGDLPALKTETQSFVGLLAVAMAICPTDPLVVNGDKKEIEKWIKYLSSEMIGLSPKDAKLTSKLHKVNKDLVQTTFFLGSQPTLVDLAFFFVLHPVVQDWNEAERYQFANITRWLDYFQHFENFHNLLKLPIIKIKKDVSPALLEKAQSEKSNKQAPKAETKPDQEKSEPQKKQPAPKKEEKKEPAKQTEAQGEKVNVSRLDIRVGKIVSVKVHEEAHSLYVEQIDVGEAKPRTVVSGLREFIPIEEMQNRFVIVLCNLKPSKLKGVLSEAMVLAASNSDHTKVELLTPLDGSKPGERLSFDGYPGEPDEQLNPKKKVWETVQAEFTTTDDCVAVYRDVPFKTTVGVIKVKSITKGVVK